MHVVGLGLAEHHGRVIDPNDGVPDFAVSAQKRLAQHLGVEHRLGELERFIRVLTDDEGGDGGVAFRFPIRHVGPHFIVGMTNSAPCTSSGQRLVTVLILVQNRTPSGPCWFVSPKAERFQPPKV